jgi:DNA polymerase-1
MAELLGLVDGRKYVWDKGQIKLVVPDVREAFRAGKGRKFDIADYSQIEVRLMAFMSQESSIIDALNAKKDIHCHMTSLVYSIDYALLDAVVVQKDKKHPRYNELSSKRSGVKTVTFGVPYGAGPKRIAEMIQQKDDNGCVIETMEHAVDRAKELIDNYFGAAPRLKEWLQEMKRMAQTKGYTCSIEGRRRWYELPSKDDPDYEKIMSQIGRYAGNHPIQSSSADMLKEALRRLYLLNRGWDGGAAEPWTAPKVVDANILLVAHDEIVTDAADKDVDRQKDMLVKAMSDAYNAVSMTKWINGVPKTIYLRDIYNNVDCIVADYWAKD